MRYGEQGLVGSRLHDFAVHEDGKATRVYSLLDYARFSLLVFGEDEVELNLPSFVKVIRIRPTENCPYGNQRLLVRPDGYIAKDMEHLA